MECFACIHCHFYQPPRENPWLEAVERQESASPHHDWNERIARECYLPNGASRILDSDHRISKLTNNYARISFNFGPTLLAWMKERSPEGYQRILDGDRESQRRFSGHGSALAQAYNHSILPLSNSRDKRTQILWGIQDFEHRFARDPEGMWLPETAVDLETLNILAAEGIKFTILAPRQANQLRLERTSPWIDLEYGIDSRRAYACNLPSGRTIGLFFYDGGLSTAVAFERLLLNGENFAHRLVSRFDPEGDSGQLMHIATDGETYGHHHAHGDMALAYALEHIEEQKLARLTNYGEYFALHPPTQEVHIHENSSWSCVHGIARWENNCGCNSGGHSQWNQEWRQPLREALDWLRDSLAAKYELESKKLLIDPWRARDEYIAAVLDRSAASVDAFLAQHSINKLSGDETVRVLRLLEMQRHLMLMYTSCGWFFDEPTGPETVQILQYAGRAVQLGQQLFGADREEQFLARLDRVHSNIPAFGNGRSIYERFVRTAMLDLPGVAAHYAISSFFDGFHPSDSIYSYQADLQGVEICESGRFKLATGRARITSRITYAQLDFTFAVLHAGGHNLCAGIAESRDDFSSLIAETHASLDSSDFKNCCDTFTRYFGDGIYSLKSMFRDERQRIVSTIVNATLENIDGLYREVYEENTGLMVFLRSLQMPLPPILRVSSEFVLANEIRRCLSERTNAERIGELLNTAEQYGVRIDASVQSAFRQRLDFMLDQWACSPLEMDALKRVESMAALLRVAPFETDLWHAQNVYYEVMIAIAALVGSRVEAAWLTIFRKLGDHLGLAQIERSLLASGAKDVSASARSSQVTPRRRTTAGADRGSLDTPALEL
jgi:alpha-amylase/alpha-mannosidase (GH57 family)